MVFEWFNRLCAISIGWHCKCFGMVFEWFNRSGAANQRGSHPWSNPVCLLLLTQNFAQILLSGELRFYDIHVINDEKF